MIAALTKWKLAVYLTAIFAAGLASGWMVATKSVRQTEVKKAVEKAVAPVTTNEFRGVKSAIYKVGLTPQQKQEADKIIERYANPMKTRHDEHMDRIRDEINKRNLELMALLTPEQKGQFDQILEKERRERRDDRDRRSEREKRDRERRGSTNAANAGKTNDCPVTNNAGSQSQAPKPPSP